jgi:hypothetical protein
MSRNILVEEAEIPEDKPQTLEEEQARQQPVEPEAGAQEAESEAPEQDEPELPEKLRGKSLTEIAEMYQNLEREYGRQANEVGTYRDLVQSLSAAKREQDLSEATETDSKKEVTADDLFEDPNAAIRRIVEQELSPLKETQQRTTHAQAIAQLHQEFPDMEQIGADPEFLAFVERNPYRLQDAQKWMQTQDVDAARRLLTDWSEFTPPKQEAKKPSDPAPRGNVAAARQDATESGGSAEVGKPLMYESDVIALMQKDPEKYESESFQAQLRDAIKEGRFRS